MNYGKTRQPLIDNGYVPLPVVPSDKRPAVKGWAEPDYLPPSGFATHNCGVACGRGKYPIAAVDIDVLEPKIAQAMLEYVLHNCGETVYRIGKAPKVLLVYRAAKPGMRKRVSRRYEIGRVEVLGEGQQFVSFGIHPDTKQPYEWLGKAPTDLQAGELPAIDEKAIGDLIVHFERIAQERGYKPITSEPTTTDNFDPTDPLDRQEPFLTINEIRKIVFGFDPPNAYDDWLNVLAAVNHETGGSAEGFALVDEWSSKGSNYQGTDDVRKKWDSFGRYTGRPKTGATLVMLAKQHGNPLDFRPTESWAAEYFVSRNGHQWLFDHTRGRWRWYDGKRWASDEKNRILTVAAETNRSIRELIKKGTDDAIAKKMLQLSLIGENIRTLRAVLEIASSKIGVTQNELDCDPMILNCQNGTIDLNTFQFRPHRSNDLLTKLCNVNFDDKAKCPKFLEFLAWASCDDSDFVKHMQQFLGVCLSGKPVQYLWFWYGLGANGKSVLWNTFSGLLGDYSLKSPFAMLSNEREGIPNDIARLVGARLVVCSEIPAGSMLNEALVKELTGGDRLAARFLHREFFEFNPTHKILLSGNHHPRIRGGDHGIWRRIVLAPFDNTVPEGQRRDMNEMLAEFAGEFPGIFNWALEGLDSFKKSGLIVPERMRAAREDYRTSEDVLADFLGELVQSQNAQVRGKDLYENYTMSPTTGHTISQKAFYECLRERGFRITKSKEGVIIHGLTLSTKGNG